MTTAVRTRRRVIAASLVNPEPVEVDGEILAAVEIGRVPGFVESTYSPMLKAAVDGCVAALDTTEGLGSTGARTGLALVSTFGDSTTTDVASELLGSGQVANPLLFFQTVPTTILGLVARDHGITGPTSCLSVCSDVAVEGLALADFLLDDPDVDQVLLVLADLKASQRTAAAECDAQDDRGGAEHDVAVALLLREDDAPGGAGSAGAPVVLDPEGAPSGSRLGHMGSVVALHRALQRARDTGRAVEVRSPHPVEQVGVEQVWTVTP